MKITNNGVMHTDVNNSGILCHAPPKHFSKLRARIIKEWLVLEIIKLKSTVLDFNVFSVLADICAD